MIHYWHTTLILLLFPFRLVLVNNEFAAYPNKRLTNNVIKTVMTSSRSKCLMLCSRMDGCLAVNVIDDHNITCELTTGLSNENDMEDDSGSELFVLGKNNIFMC